MAHIQPASLPAPPLRFAVEPRIGEPQVSMVRQRLLLSPPHLSGAELGSIQAALESGWVAPAGPVPRAFEAAVAEVTGFPHVLAVASGTAALHLAYRCLGVDGHTEPELWDQVGSGRIGRDLPAT